MVHPVYDTVSLPSASHPASTPRDGAESRTARRVLRPAGRRRARAQSHLAGLSKAARVHLCHRYLSDRQCCREKCIMLSGWGEGHQLIDARRPFAIVALRDLPDAEQRIGVAPQHKPLQGLDFVPVFHLGRPKDPVAEIADQTMDFAPLDTLPVSLAPGTVCRRHRLYRTFPVMHRLTCRLWVVHLVHVSGLSAWVLPYPPSYGFPLPFGWWRSLLGPSSSHWRIPSPLRLTY